MPVERYEVGKNAYNKRKRISVSGDSLGTIEGANTLRESFESMAITLEGRIEPYVQWAKVTLQQKGMPLDPNAWCYADKAWRHQNEHSSPEWFAIRILLEADWMGRMLKRGDARMAADFAFSLGALITEADFIVNAYAGTAKRGGLAKAANTRQRIESRDLRCRRVAADMWARSPHRKDSEIARSIARGWREYIGDSAPLAVRTIRGKIADLNPKKR